MNRGLVVGLFGLLLLVVLVVAGIAASWTPRDSASTSPNVEATNSWLPLGAASPGGRGERATSLVAPIHAVSPRPLSSAVPVAVHVQPLRSPVTQPSPAMPTPAASRLLSTTRASSGGASPRPLATIKPQPLPSIVLAANGLPEGVPYAGEHDPIRIASVTLSADEVRGGDIASARVITTSNAAALTARIGTYQVNVPRVAPGIFSIAITVPHLPLRNQSVDIIVTAIRSDGATAQTTVPLKVSF